jgi:hypothetical protein
VFHCGRGTAWARGQAFGRVFWGFMGIRTGLVAATTYECICTDNTSAARGGTDGLVPTLGSVLELVATCRVHSYERESRSNVLRARLVERVFCFGVAVLAEYGKL